MSESSLSAGAILPGASAVLVFASVALSTTFNK